MASVCSISGASLASTNPEKRARILFPFHDTANSLPFHWNETNKSTFQAHDTFERVGAYWRATMLFKISTTYTLWSAQHRFLLAFDQFVNRSFINFFAYRRYLTQKCVLVARSRLKVLFRSFLDYTQQIKEQEKNRSTNCCSRACQWL